VTFHDYNGDGIKEENEPVVPGIFLRFSPTDNVTTDEKGIYEIALSGGQYRLNIFPGKVLGYNDQPFTYINISKAEYISIYDDLNLEINTDRNYDIALMQGFLTVPFAVDTEFFWQDNPFGIFSYVDMDDRIGYMKTWNNSGNTADNHSGTDFIVKQDTSVLAAAPGKVIDNPGPSNVNQGNPVFILHEKGPYVGPTSTAYIHLNKALVKPGDIIQRGDLIGLSGKSFGEIGFGQQHLHLSILVITRSSNWGCYYTDPYRNLTPQKYNTVNLWTVDNSPQYP